MATSNQSYRSSIIKSHSSKSLANIRSGSDRVTYGTNWAGRVDIYETNSCGAYSSHSLHIQALALHTWFQILTGSNGFLLRGWAERETIATIGIINTPPAETKEWSPHIFNGCRTSKADKICRIEFRTINKC
jgi:hypothetical protein